MGEAVTRAYRGLTAFGTATVRWPMRANKKKSIRLVVTVLAVSLMWIRKTAVAYYYDRVFARSGTFSTRDVWNLR